MQRSTRGKAQELHLDAHFPLPTSRLQQYTARLFHMPFDLSDTPPLVPSRHLRATQLLKRFSPPSSVKSLPTNHSRLLYFLPEDFPPFDPSIHQLPHTHKVLRMKTTRLSEPRRRLVPEAAPLVTKEFPGKKVIRRPAIVGHLPEASKKRLLLTLTGGARLSLE